MPIYEYVCMKCESHFEELVRGDEDPACPDCGGAKVARQFSVFAAHGISGPQPSFGPTKFAGGGGCCGGSCGCG
jgi:putative FmdB family regulatory protein